MLAIALVSGRAILNQDFVSPYPDAWAYCSFAEYLGHNSRSVFSHLPPVEQFASSLRDTRFGAPSLLAFLAKVTGGNPATGVIWLIVLASANIFMGYTVWCRVLKCSAGFCLGAGFFAVVCSWMRDAIVVGNLDNLLFLAILPYFLARYLLFTRGPKNAESILALGINAAALFYVYPEGMMIAGALFLPFLVWKVVDDLAKRRQVRAYIFLILATFLLTGPYVGVFCSFLGGQLAAVNGDLRPGINTFNGLLSPALLPAIFGLANEFNGTNFSILNSLLPSFLILLITMAAYFWWRTNRSLFFCLLSLSWLAVWQGVFKRYDYGLYKILLIGSACWIPAVFVGLNVSCRQLFPRTCPAWQMSAVVLLTAWALWEKSVNFDSLWLNREIPMKPYQQISRIRNLVGKGGVILKMRSDFNQEWAVFFLRNVPLKIPTQRGYMAAPSVSPVMARAEYAVSDPGLVLTDLRSPQAIWQNQLFWLVPKGNFTFYDYIDGPNQVETIGGKPFVWIGNKPTAFTVESPVRQVIRFYAPQGWLGPSLPNCLTRTMLVKTDNLQRIIVSSGPFSVELPVESGKSRVEIWCEDKPSASVPGDPRVLLFGLWDFQFESIDDKSLILR